MSNGTMMPYQLSKLTYQHQSWQELELHSDNLHHAFSLTQMTHYPVSSPVTMQSESIRTDRVRWVSEDASVVGDAVRSLKGLGDRFATAVGYECLDAPSRCMVARYEQGGYRTHLDHDPPSDDDLYWLWASSREQSQRVLTCILYLTDEDFDADIHGGCLRLFLGCDTGDASGETAISIKDVAPVPGRLVVFKSRRVPHAVLDTSRRRLALSCWHLAPEA